MPFTGQKHVLGLFPCFSVTYRNKNTVLSLSFTPAATAVLSCQSNRHSSQAAVAGFMNWGLDPDGSWKRWFQPGNSVQSTRLLVKIHNRYVVLRTTWCLSCHLLSMLLLCTENPYGVPSAHFVNKQVHSYSRQRLIHWDVILQHC